MFPVRPVEIVRQLERIVVEMAWGSGAAFHIEVVADAYYQIGRHRAGNIDSQSCRRRYASAWPAENRHPVHRKMDRIDHRGAYGVRLANHSRLVAGELTCLGCRQKVLSVKNRRVSEVGDEIPPKDRVLLTLFPVETCDSLIFVTGIGDRLNNSSTRIRRHRYQL